MQKSLTRINRLFPVCLLVFASGLLGQLRYDVPSPAADRQLKALASPSWLDPQRFSMDHSLSFSMGSVLGLPSGASSLSVYTNQMNYLLTHNLMISSRIHLVQSGLMGAQQLGQNPLEIFYQAGMDWRLSPNFNIHLGVSNLPRGLRNPAMSRYGYQPFQGPGAGEAVFAEPITP